MMSLMTPERDWEGLGRSFAAARKAARMSQVEAAERLHVSRTAIQAIERGRQSNGQPFTKITLTMRAYARLVGWTEDSPERVAEGGEPEMASTEEERTAPERQKSDLPPAIDLELRSSKYLDGTVVHLGSEDSDVRIIAFLVGADDMSEEELEERWRQWRRARRHLQGIASNSDTPRDS